MPIPLIPIISAIAAGGSLVPHAAGGLIVTSASGYVAGTYLSTAAIGGLIATASTTLGAGALYLSGAAASIIGSAGIFGTTIGASGITGVLMSAGIISSTPVWVPLAVGGAALGCGYGSYRLLRLRKKISATPAGQEAQFTETEAKIVENLVKRLGKKDSPDKEFKMKQIQSVISEAPKLEGRGNVKYQLWLDDCGVLYVQFIGNDGSGTFSDLLFSASQYASVRNSKASIGFPNGYDLINNCPKTSENENDGAFLKAVLCHLLP